MPLQNTFYLDVDFKKKTFINEPIVTQNDEVTFVLRVYDDGLPYDLTGVSTFTLASYRPDKQSVLTAGTNTGTNEITFALGSTEISVPGKVNASIQLYDADGRVSTIPFTYKVLKDIGVGYIPSEDEQTLIELVLGQGPVILEDAKAIADELRFTGPFVLANPYKKNNLVSFEGSMYIAKVDTQNNPLPILPILENEWWAFAAKQGEQGDQGIQGEQGDQGIQGEKGDPGKDGTGAGTVTAVNNTLPDETGNVTLDIPDPDLSAYATKERVTDIAINVKDFGAIGDGITDDTDAFISAYNSTPAGGTLLIPTPTVKYLLTSTFVINKPIKIKGSKQLYEFENGFEKANIIEFSSVVKTGIRVDTYNVNIENLSIHMTSITSDTVAGIHLNGTVEGLMRHNTISNVEIIFAHIYGIGVKGSGVLVTYLNNVHTWQGAYGFYFDGLLNTSINFQNTWARAHSEAGYYLDNTSYCSFTNATSDSINQPDYGYVIKNSNTISLYSSACEYVKKSYLYIDNSKEINVIGFFGAFANSNGTGTSIASFAQVVNGSKHVSFIGCKDYNAHLLNTNSIYVGADCYVPISMNCDFRTGINNNGSIYSTLDPTEFYTEMKIGLATFIDNAKGSGSMVLDGRAAFGTKQKRLGVMNDTLGGWQGYIENDGTFFVGGLTTLPTANVNNRGAIRRKIGTTGVADELYICIKNTSEGYEWKKITLS